MRLLSTYMFIVAALWYGSIQAQSTFQKYYYGAGTAQMDLHELSSGNLFTGMAYQSGTSVMDPEGNIVHTHCYAIDTFLVLQTVKKIADNEFVFGGSYYFPSVARQPVIGKIDSMGIVLASNYYDLTTTTNINTVGNIQITAGDDVLAWGKRELFVVRFDPLGNVVWSRIYNVGGEFKFIKELPSGDLLAGLDVDSIGAAVARLDPNGNFIWLKSYFRTEGVVKDCVIESDSSFTIIGHTDRDHGAGTQLYMMRLDGSGDVQWCKGYQSNAGWFTHRAHLDRTLDGNYVVLANIIGHGTGKAFLMKTDQNGDTLWTRGAGVVGTHYEVYNLLPYSDGGYLFNGQGFGLGTFLFKADSLGRLPCPEHEQYYPVQVPNLFPTDSSFTLTYTSGATRHPAFIHDTIYDPVTVVDGCTITHVNERPTKQLRPRLRPNPNTGRFTVQFHNPLQVDSFYSVYDLTGKLLYQRPLATGTTTEDIDLSRFGKGTYLLKFTTPEEVWNERVVVE